MIDWSKIVRRLEDAVDAVVVVGNGSQAVLREWASMLPAGRTQLLTSEALGEGNGASLAAALRARGVKRPLLWLVGENSIGLADAFPRSITIAADPLLAPDLLTPELGAHPSPTAWSEVENRVVAWLSTASVAAKRLNVLVLYNDRFTHIDSTRHHLEALATKSRHRMFFLPAEQRPVSDPDAPGGLAARLEAWPNAFDLERFDVVVWHYSLPAYKAAPAWPSDFLAEGAMRRLAAFGGLKVLFVQDEYDGTAQIWEGVRAAGVDLVMTCVPAAAHAYVYPQAEVPGVEFLQTLTGFVPEDRDFERFAMPMERRSLRLAYRARELPFRYGALGREKVEIGERMRALATERGVAVDIEISEASRIYGDDWYRFLGSARAMLATESGSNVFDFDGALRAAEAGAAGQDYDSFAAAHLRGRDGVVRMNQVSPKIFEAIMLRTALVCFEGEYSGVIQPDAHFIALKKDFSNAGEVFEKLEDLTLLTEMTDQAYTDVIEDGRYGYGAFVRNFDRIIETRVVRPAACDILSAPILARRRGEVIYTAITRPQPVEFALNDGVLFGSFQSPELEAVLAQGRDAEASILRWRGDTPSSDARIVYEAGPETVVCYDFWKSAGAGLALSVSGARIATPPVAWHYGAGMPLDFSGVDFEHQYCWVALNVADAVGDLLVSLYDGAKDEIRGERPIVAQAGETTVFLPVEKGTGSLLLFRTGGSGGSGAASLRGVKVLAESAYAPEISSLLRSLGEQARSGRPQARRMLGFDTEDATM